MELDVARAEKEIAGAGTYLLGRPECTSKSYGVIGFCMGGALAQYTATKEKNVGAAASFYGGFKRVASDWANLTAPILLIYAENDQGVPVEQGRAIAKELADIGKRVHLVTYPNTGHAFCNDTGANYNAEAAADALQKAVDFFRANVT